MDRTAEDISILKLHWDMNLLCCYAIPDSAVLYEIVLGFAVYQRKVEISFCILYTEY